MATPATRSADPAAPRAAAPSPRALLRERGLRATSHRQAVLRALLEAQVPLRASVLLQRVAGLDRATLYRTLNRLVEVGLARIVVELGGSRRFAWSGGTSDPSPAVTQFHCTCCGGRFPVPNPAVHLSVGLPRWSPALEQARVHVTLTGVCPDCLAEDAA